MTISIRRAWCCVGIVFCVRPTLEREGDRDPSQSGSADAGRGASGYGYPLGVFAASRVVVYVLLAVAGWSSRAVGAGLSFNAVFSSLVQWDASWYRWIALHGYDRVGAHGHHANVMAFYPLYPLAYRLVASLPGPMSLWGSVLSSVLFAVALCVLYRLSLQRFDQPMARRTVLYLAMSPLSWVFSIPYSESLFLLLALVAFTLTAEKRRWSGCVAASLAVLTRPVGLALVPALAWQIRRDRPRFREYLPLLLPIVAEVGFFAYAAWHTGDALSPIHSQQHGWHRAVSVLPVLVGHVLWADVIQHGQLRFLVDIGFAILWCGLFVHAWRMRLPGEYLIFAALAILLPTSAGLLVSIGRFGTISFPFFWALADLGRNHRAETLIKTTFPLLAAALMYLAYGAATLNP